MKTRRSGTCSRCKKEYFFSIGAPTCKLTDTDSILTWFNSVGEVCYLCGPIPEKYRQQSGVVMWKTAST